MFARHGGRLAAMPVGSRVVYSAWLLMLLAALFVASELVRTGPGWSASGAVEHFRGAEAEPGASGGGHGVGDGGRAGGLGEVEGVGGDSSEGRRERTPAGGIERRSGPRLELGGVDDPADSLVISEESAGGGPRSSLRVGRAMNRQRLLETTHGHLFMMPMVFLVLAHLFVLAGWGRWVTGVGLACGALGVTLHLAAPWLVRDVGAGFGTLFPVSGALLLVSHVGMALGALVAMWFPPRRGSATGSDGAVVR